jgi:E3 ubiquitin-protein ligase MARCH6
MSLQNAEAIKAKRSIKDDYTIVYLPPYLQYRVIGFITLVWIFGAIVIGFGIALPFQLGRSFFKLFTLREVHDGYSFIIGFYLVWMCYLFARAIDRLDKRRQRRGGDGPRPDLYILVLKRGLLWIAKITYMMLSLGIVIPVLLAIVVDLYIVLPIRFTLDPTLTPRIRIVDTWALGLLYAKIAFHAHNIQPPNRIARGLQNIMTHGWTRPDPVSATKEVIAPLAGGLLGMIFFPGLVFRTVQYFLPSVPLDNRFMPSVMHVYPTVFLFAATLQSAAVAYDLLSSWSQTIRDKEFLVEMKLRNHEPELEKVHEKGK